MVRAALTHAAISAAVSGLTSFEEQLRQGLRHAKEQVDQRIAGAQQAVDRWEQQQRPTLAANRRRIDARRAQIEATLRT